MLRDIANSYTRVAIITHKIADMDAAASSVAVGRALKTVNPNINVRYFSEEGVSSQVKNALRELGVGFEDPSSIVGYRPEAVIMLDVGSLDQAGEGVLKSLELVKEGVRELIVIDHHPYNQEIKDLASKYILDPMAVSTSEIVAKLMHDERLLDKDSACILLRGLLVDSRNLQLVDCYNLPVVTLLCDFCGARIKELKSRTHRDLEAPEVIARVKGLQRARLYRIRDFLVAITNVGSYHSSVAQSIVALGVDLSVVLGRDGRRTIGAIRASSRFQNRTGIHLGRDLARALASRLGGSGGGHMGAAAFTVESDLGVAVDGVLDLLKTLLKSDPVEVT